MFELPLKDIEILHIHALIFFQVKTERARTESQNIDATDPGRCGNLPKRPACDV